MKQHLQYLTLILLIGFAHALHAAVYQAANFGFKPGANVMTNSTAAARLCKALAQRATTQGGQKTDETDIVFFEHGEYHFYPQDALKRDWYISNHDQTLPRTVAFALENCKNVIIDGGGSTFLFHGRMMPFGITGGQNIHLARFAIDYVTPHITQLDISAVNTQTREVTFSVAPYVNANLRGSRLFFRGFNWENSPWGGILFEANRRIAHRTQDEAFDLGNVRQIGERNFVAKLNNVGHFKAGQHFVTRTGGRPCPGIFAAEVKDLFLDSVTIHYAEGMGLIAQLCENITIDGLRVARRSADDLRCFTTQADATHFSGCKGKIISTNGFYEGMMDDAINVHGTYLKVTKRIDNHTLEARYMHPQAWGFKWGDKGDQVQFITSRMMEIVGQTNTITEITAIDKPVNAGGSFFRIRFADTLVPELTPQASIGIENLTWTPSVTFENNLIRNNRARGTLFSTPRAVRCVGNTFDNTSGTAILLCGDCNGWYETGACRDVLIANNTFIDGLGSSFQFCEAVISICPVIPESDKQKQYFHSGIVIRDNTFRYYDKPLLFANSVDGLIFKDNTLEVTKTHSAWHWNKRPFTLRHVTNDTLIEPKIIQSPSH